MNEPIDFGQRSDDYMRYRAGFPEALFKRLHRDYGIGAAGQRVLDVGTGTGSLARGFAARGCDVVALDPSTRLLAAARQLDNTNAVQFVRAYAEATGLTSTAFDVATAGQCWHWFDRPRAAAEMMRVLDSGGHLVITHFDWLALPGNMVESTLYLIHDYNPAWQPPQGGAYGLYPAWLNDVAIAGFRDIETFSFDVTVPYTHEAWRGRIRASAGVIDMPQEIVVQFDSTLKDVLWMNHPQNPLHVPHRVWALVCRA
jgi:SAM-dependent methyltransferase